MLTRSEYERARRLIADGSAERWFQDVLFDPDTSDEFNRTYRNRKQHPYIYVSARLRSPQPGGVGVTIDGVTLLFEPRPLPVGNVVRTGLRPLADAKVAFVIGLAAEQRTHIELVRTRKPWMVFVIHPSTRSPGRWQMTHFDRRGPSGDTLNDRLEPLVHEALHTWNARVFRPGTLDPRVRRFDPEFLERMTPRANPARRPAPRRNPVQMIANEIPEKYAAEIREAAPRAIAAGARAPLEYLGMGGYGIVFRDARRTWKIARSAFAARGLAEEYEWFRTAAQVPWVRDHVVRVYAWHPREGVLERESLEPRGPLGWTRPDRRQTWAIHREIQDRMIPYGWSAPEYKDTSYIHVRGRGAVLFDGSMAHVLGSRMARYVTDILAGRTTPDAYENAGTLAFYIRREVDEGAIPKHIGARLLERIAAWGARHNPARARRR